MSAAICKTFQHVHCGFSFNSGKWGVHQCSMNWGHWGSDDPYRHVHRCDCGIRSHSQFAPLYRGQ